jgi:hypothetical protein
MPNAPKQENPEPKQRGPQPDLLKIDKDWKEAVQVSFAKKKPVSGWPKDK